MCVIVTRYIIENEARWFNSLRHFCLLHCCHLVQMMIITHQKGKTQQQQKRKLFCTAFSRQHNVLSLIYRDCSKICVTFQQKIRNNMELRHEQRRQFLFSLQNHFEKVMQILIRKRNILQGNEKYLNLQFLLAASVFNWVCWQWELTWCEGENKRKLFWGSSDVVFLLAGFTILFH